jgi:hypothetical protein
MSEFEGTKSVGVGSLIKRKRTGGRKRRRKCEGMSCKHRPTFTTSHCAARKGYSGFSCLDASWKTDRYHSPCDILDVCEVHCHHLGRHTLIEIGLDGSSRWRWNINVPHFCHFCHPDDFLPVRIPLQLLPTLQMDHCRRELAPVARVLSRRIPCYVLFGILIPTLVETLLTISKSCCCYQN